MELVVKGRGIRVTDHMRRSAEHKLAKLGRFEPRVARLEVEIIGEHNPRIDGSHRVEIACDTPGRTFRAEAAADDVDTALDIVLERLERQISSYRGKLRRHPEKRGQSSRIEK